MQLSSAICLDLELSFLGTKKCEPTYTEIKIIGRASNYFFPSPQTAIRYVFVCHAPNMKIQECTVLAFILKHSLPLCLSVCFLP